MIMKSMMILDSRFILYVCRNEENEERYCMLLKLMRHNE